MNEPRTLRRRLGALLAGVAMMAGMAAAGAFTGTSPAFAATGVQATDAVVAAGAVSCSVGRRNAYTDADSSGSWVVMSAQIVCSPKANLIVIYAHGYRDIHLVENPAPVRCYNTTSCTMLVSFDNPPGTQRFVARYEAVGSIVGPPHSVSEVRPFNIAFTG